MGAKQSKRSVDISGKEAEGGGEVAVAGAGGEGRVEQLADADALKPQLNGAAHIQHEQTDKEKELDSGTPENEKDATTEKEAKEEEDNEKEAAPVTNGETEPKVENGDSTPTPEDGKKPKKEKVKKKWSLRSISFSRKDKPKQEKKQKEEELKTNGEPEKVPEETAEAVPEAAANEVAEEVKAPAEEKNEKTPETPVTEPLTNGTSTPESTKAETPASEEAAPAPAPSPPADAIPEPAPEPQPEPEQLPINGLSLEEPKLEIPEVEKPEEIKPEPPVAETAEIVPAPEIPKEVCVEQLPLLEPTPPPLPANPPPSSVASFAATTMAPELTDASLANTADAAIAPLSALPETKDILARPEPQTETVVTKIPENEIPFVLKENNEDTPVTVSESEIQNNALQVPIVTDMNLLKHEDESAKLDIEVVTKEPSETTTVDTENPEIITPNTNTSKIIMETLVTETVGTVTETVITEIPEPIIETVITETLETIPETVVTAIPETITETVVTEIPETITETVIPDIPLTVQPEPTQIEIPVQSESIETVTTKVESAEVDIVKMESPGAVPANNELDVIVAETEIVQNKAETPVQAIVDSVVPEPLPEPENIPEFEVDISEADDSSLPPPPMQDEEDSAPALDEVDEKVEESLKQIPEPITETEQAIVESNHISNAETTNGVHDISPDAADDTEALKKKARAALASAAESITCHGGEEAPAPADAPRLPNGASAPPAAEHTPQEPLPVSDKLADLIPEVPDVPELKPETLQETVTDVAVAN